MARMTLEEITDKLNQCIAAKHIWNVDFMDLKDRLGSLIRDLDWNSDKRDLLRNVERMLPEMTFCYMGGGHDLLATIKKIQVAATKAKLIDDPVIQAFLEFWKPFAATAQLINEVKPFIVKGRKPAVNSTPMRTLENTGTCGCCRRNIKLYDNGQIWDHGFEIADRGRGYGGYKTGASCFGQRYLPIEVSNQVWIDMLARMEQDLVELPGRVKSLAARLKEMPKPVDKHSWLMTQEEKEVAMAYGLVQVHLYQQREYLKRLPRDIKDMKTAIAEWKARPLPGTR